jgi:hypothetical protein
MEPAPTALSKGESLVKRINVFILVIALTLTLASGSLFAQKVDKGIRFGYISSDINNDGESWYDNTHNSFYVGIFNDKQLIPMLYFYSAFEYYQAGNNQDDNNKLVLHYLSVPVALKVKIGPVQGFAGVHGAVKVSSKYTVAGESGPAEGFNTFDAGTFIGGGLRFLFIGAEAKYNWGLVNIKDGYKNNFWQVGLTLWF